ncbi:MAG: hypothetical protein LBU64_14830, partial [Planctomycetota bacterium]|nr:hypothetical protein [Planctomycetota bacterium]
ESKIQSFISAPLLGVGSQPAMKRIPDFGNASRREGAPGAAAGFGLIRSGIKARPKITYTSLCCVTNVVLVNFCPTTGENLPSRLGSLSKHV